MEKALKFAFYHTESPGPTGSSPGVNPAGCRFLPPFPPALPLKEAVRPRIPPANQTVVFLPPVRYTRRYKRSKGWEVNGLTILRQGLSSIRYHKKRKDARYAASAE